MTLHDPLWLQGLTYSALDDRQALGGIGDPGVLGAADLAVSQRAAGANMTVDVAAGRAIIAGPAGSYLVWSDAVENLAIAAAPSPGNSRIDVVYAEVRDVQAMGGVDDDWRVAVVTGTPSSTPVAPAIPAYAIELARITVGSATTSITNGIITNARRHSASPADRSWPRMGTNTPADATTDITVVSWGSVVLPAPNRPIRLVAMIDGSVIAAGGSTNCVCNLSLRVSTPAGTIATSSTAKAFSASALGGYAPISRHLAVDFTPGTGEAVTVVGRAQCEVGGSASFVNGRLTVEAFPA